MNVTRALAMKDQRAVSKYGRSVSNLVTFAFFRWITFSVSNKSVVFKLFRFGFCIRVGYPVLYSERSGARRVRRFGILSWERL